MRQTHPITFTSIACIALGLFVGCNQKPSEMNSTTEEIKEVLDLEARDTSINPADDFFGYANGNWMKNNEIPSSKTGWGSFYIVRDNALERLHEILDSAAAVTDAPKGSPTQLIGDFYRSFMDTAAIEEKGLQPAQSDLDRIARLSDAREMMDEVMRMCAEGNSMMFSMYVSPDKKDSEVQRLNFSQGGLGLPNRDYYFDEDDKSEEIRNKYVEYVTDLLIGIGRDEASAQRSASNILALETEMAAASKSRVELRDTEANYNIFTVDEFEKHAPALGLKRNLGVLGADVEVVQVGQPEFYSTLSGLIESKPLDVWKDYLTYHTIDGWATYLSSQFADLHFDFHNRTLNGQKTPEVRWKRAVQLVDRTFGDALGRIYVEKHFPASAKEYMLELVGNLEEAYAERIENITWMGDTTKTKALEKLRSFAKKIGYPDTWKDYSDTDIVPDDLVSNIRSHARWYSDYNMAKLGKPVDRSEWFMSPQTVNAYYNPLFNEIAFPAGILQPPFFYPDGDDAVNYGAIGVVIGHEMTHGFDDQGSRYDVNGNLSNWWTDQDRENFKNLTNRIVEQYSAYTVLDGLPVNGEFTQGENIADNGGLAIAYAAFQKTEQAKRGEKISGLTPDQRFFLAYAQVWCIKNTDERLRMRIGNDPHSPEMFRVNGPVSNMPEFYEAFGVTPENKLYREESVRTTVW